MQYDVSTVSQYQKSSLRAFAVAELLSRSPFAHKGALRTRKYVSTVGVCAPFLGEVQIAITPGIQLYATPGLPGPRLRAQH